MAKYDVKFSCGHTETVNLLGKKDVRAWRISQMEENEICSKCKEQQKQEYREEMLRRADELEMEHDLPELSGTPRQIQWARQIRAEVIGRIPAMQKRADVLQTGAYAKKSVEEIAALIGEIFERILAAETSASFWIEASGLHPREVNEFERLRECYARREALKEESEKKKEIEREIEEQSTILPENFNHNPLVKIELTRDKVKMKSAKDETIIDLVRSLGYKWNGETWEKVINYRNAPAEDRAAELGNKLLSLGYGIICAEEIVREKAVSGDIEPEHKRWISVEKGEQRFMIFFEKNHELYQKLRKIPTAKYESGVIYVSISAYREIEEAADLFGFRFSKPGKEILEKYKEKIESLPRQKVGSAAEKKYRDGLSEILGPAGILDDLKDE